MLATSFNYFLIIFLFLVNVVGFTVLFFKKNLFVFTKVWLVFIYFLLLMLLLSFFGEDFFIIFALATELPVFFGFFFFFIVKNQLAEVNEKVSYQKIKYGFLSCFASVLLFSFFEKTTNTYTVLNFYTTCFLLQRSDFYLYYVTYLVFAPYLIIFIGLLLTIVTGLLIVISFCQQLQEIAKKKKLKHLAWTKTQNINKQSNFKSSVLFFRI